MKKIIAAAVTVTTVLSLAACGGNTAVDKSDCLDVPQDVLNVVASGSDSSGLKPETEEWPSSLLTKYRTCVDS